MADGKGLTIDPNELIEKLNQVQKEADGDLARMIELLLLENHVLQLGQSSGFRRGTHYGFSKFPRFLQLNAPTEDADEQEAKKEEEGGDLAQ